MITATRSLLATLFFTTLPLSPAWAVPGPDSVAIVANRNVPGSVMLAARYAEARAVPARQRCDLDLPTGDTLTLEEFRARLAEPLRRCLEDGGVDGRIEAYVLMRGVPLRVSIPASGGAQAVSLTAALMVERSRMPDGRSLLDAPPGNVATCGSTPCLAARWSNPWRDGVFTPAWTLETPSVRWQLRLATMLHGRSDDDAARLLRSALDAEAAGSVPGTWLFMNGADRARGALDVEYDTTLADLRDVGITDVARVPFDTALTGRTLAAFVTGTASLGATVEGNRYAPGAIVDNLTSFGAVPMNFAPTGEVQVSIARWVAQGVAGVHGTVDEPLNNCFPRRRFLSEYAEGSTLAEAYHRNLPFTYWRNLVLGDPMAAPWAHRPRVTLDDLRDGASITTARTVNITAAPPDGARVASLVVYVDGVERARAADDHASLCLSGDGPRELLAVAQLAEATGVGLHAPKGWTRVRVVLRGAVGDCDGGVVAGDASTDASAVPGDASADARVAIDAAEAPRDASGDTMAADGATPTSPAPPGCGCRASSSRPPRAFLFALLAVVVRRRRAHAPITHVGARPHARRV